MEKRVICKLEHITKEFPGVIALDDISFDVVEGEIHAIVGENGAGKSTLMNILSGAYCATSGKIEFDGNPVQFSSTLDAQKLGISMIHQELSLANTLSIAENIFQSRLPKGKLGLLSKTKLLAAARTLLDEVGLRFIDPITLVRNINVSQQQQVEIAKALSLNAKFLIMDEPTSALTPSETKILMDIMRELRRKGITMLYISHKLDEVMEISDRITVLRDGRYVDTLTTCHTTIHEMITLMVGREYSCSDMRENYMRDYTDAKPVLEVKGLSINGKVHDVSFKLYEGEVLGLTGLVGAGRSEVLQAVFGADHKDGGSFFIDGKPASIKNCAAAIAHGIGLVPEGRKSQGLFLKFSVQQNMTMVYLRKLTAFLGFVKTMQESAIAEEYKTKLRVKTPSLEQRIINLSGGNQQKTIIARWLMNNPRILFLDEPTQGIDIGAKNEIYDIIDKLSKSGVSVIVVSSEMQETIGLCDRILVMHEGKISGEILHDEACEKSIMTYMSGAHKAST